MPLGDPPDLSRLTAAAPCCAPKVETAYTSWGALAATVDVSPAIAGVLRVLPPPGTKWPDVEKAKFMAALGAVLDLIYPTPDSAEGDAQ